MIRADTKGVSEAAVIGIPPTTTTRARMERQQAEETPKHCGTGPTSGGYTGIAKPPTSAREKAGRQQLLREGAARREKEAAEYCWNRHQQEQERQKAAKLHEQRQGTKARMAETVAQWKKEMAGSETHASSQPQAPVPEPSGPLAQSDPLDSDPRVIAGFQFLDLYPQCTIVQLVNMLEMIQANSLDGSNLNTYVDLYHRYYDGKAKR